MEIDSPFSSMEDFFEKGHKYFLPNLSIDCVIFGFNNNQLKVLLLKWRELAYHSLPGGFILKGEHIDDSAKRILEERTGITNVYLRQFQVFGAPQRAVHPEKRSIFKTLGFSVPKESWILDRFVSIGYYALVDFSKVTPKEDLFSESIDWWDLSEVPELIFDHNTIVNDALKAMRLQLDVEPVGLTLLPEKFTLPELQKIYETILGKTIDRRNFRKKMINSGKLEKLDELKKGGAHRAANLYRFKNKP